MQHERLTENTVSKDFKSSKEKYKKFKQKKK